MVGLKVGKLIQKKNTGFYVATSVETDISIPIIDNFGETNTVLPFFGQYSRSCCFCLY